MRRLCAGREGRLLWQAGPPAATVECRTAVCGWGLGPSRWAVAAAASRRHRRRARRRVSVLFCGRLVKAHPKFVAADTAPCHDQAIPRSSRPPVVPTPPKAETFVASRSQQRDSTTIDRQLPSKRRRRRQQQPSVCLRRLSSAAAGRRGRQPPSIAAGGGSRPASQLRSPLGLGGEALGWRAWQRGATFEGQLAGPAQQTQQQAQQQAQQQMQQAAAQPADSGTEGCCDGAELLALLLQHPVVARGDQDVLCRLLSSSKQAAALVARHCGGGVDAALRLNSVEQAQDAAAWLRRNAQLLRSLALRPWLGVIADVEPATSALAAGLREAEQLEPGSLSRLQSLTCSGRCSPLGPLLQALGPARSSPLTRLELRTWPDVGAAVPFASALAQLRGLRHLELHCSVAGPRLGGEAKGECRDAGAALASALGGLTRLTCLVCGEGAELTCQQLLQLPVSLEHLEVAVQLSVPQEHAGGTRAPRVDLGHLTRLTELRLNGALDQGSTLPQSLVSLQAWTAAGSPRLLVGGLTSLRRLEIASRADELCDLARHLPSLDDLTLCHVPHEHATWPPAADPPDDGGFGSAVGACARLPIRCARLVRPSVLALQQLGRLSGITSLSLWWRGALVWEVVPVPSDKLTAALRSLPGLRRLYLRGAELQAGAGGSCGTQALRAIAHLPELRSLGLSSCRVGGVDPEDVGAELSPAVQLTQLELERCGASDAMLAPVLAALTGLVRLQVRGPRAHVTDASVAALCRLSRLTHLDVHQAGLNYVALQCLWASLPQLAELNP